MYISTLVNKGLYYNLGMMLARDYTSCHAARNTLVMLVANNVHK